MTPVTRSAEPAILAQRGARWTTAFLARRASDPLAAFAWPEVDGIPLNQLLGPHLRRMTAGHCAYCDHFELGDGSRETIDHFQPKSSYPERALTWDNLFPCCDQCQQYKGEKHHPDLLRPDAVDYRFEVYFLFNSHTGMIEVNPRATAEDQRRAACTLELLGLNRGRRPDARRRHFKLFYAASRWRRGQQVDALPHRFLAPR